MLSIRPYTLLCALPYVVASPRQIFDPCYSWPGSVYAGDGMCFLLVETEFDFKTSKVGGSVAILRLAMMREGGGGGDLGKVRWCW